MRFRRIHIKDGEVINITQGDTTKPFKGAEGINIVNLLEDQTEVAMGYKYSDGKFVKPEPIIVEYIKTKEELLEERIIALEKRLEGK